MQMNLSQGPRGGLSELEEILGGMERMASRYPRTYQAYQSTTMERDILLTANENTSYDIEITHVGYSDASGKSIVVDLETSAEKEEGYCILAADVLHRDGRILAKAVEENFLGDMQHLSLKIPAEGICLEDVRIRPSLYRIGDSIKRYGADTPGAEEYSINLSGYILDPKCEFTILDPRIKHTNLSNKNINVAYLYPYHFTQDITDYFFSREDMRDGHFRLPSKGSIKVSGVNVGDACQCFLKLVNESKTIRWHHNCKAECKTSGLIEWEIPEDWGFSYSDLLNKLEESITYTLSVQVVMQGLRTTFTVTNDKGYPAVNRREIPPIIVYKDCFVEGTQIRMADGSEQTIERLRPGDWVRSENGSAMVLNVLSGGGSDTLAHIQTEDGLELFITANHPLETPEGLRCAAFLSTGDVLKTMQGESRVKYACALPEARGQRYSIQLENGHRVYANGILAGDSHAEMTEGEKAFNLRYQVPEAWRNDYDSWVARHRGE